jgi:mRNA-degrading endonuclease toxin of MazEF toxin-antitoxin module
LPTPGEENLIAQSVVNIPQIFTLSKADLRRRISALDQDRVRKILDDINLLLESKGMRR